MSSRRVDNVRELKGLSRHKRLNLFVARAALTAGCSVEVDRGLQKTLPKHA